MGDIAKICSVNCFNICNLFKFPLPMNDNPFYKVTLEIKKEHSDKDNKEFLKTEIRSLFQKTSGQKRSLFTIYRIDDVPHWKELHKKLSPYKETALFSPWHHKKPFAWHDPLIFNGLNAIVSPKSDVSQIEKYCKDIFRCDLSTQESIEKLYISFIWDAYIHDQYKKIKQLKKSFDENGYRPDKFPSPQGGVCGYWLKYENIKRFYVENGAHRAAVYSALFPDEPLHCVYATKKICNKIRCHNKDAQFLQIYDLKDINNWPSVKNKFLTALEAREILKKYVMG